jgi:hypothetical protein
MSQFRISIVATLISAAVVCAVWALPNTTAKQDKKCYDGYVRCHAACPDGGGFWALHCDHECHVQLDACYKRVGISVPPGGFPTLTTAQPTGTPKSKVPTSGPLRQTSPTPTPHQSPTTIFKKKKSDH